MHVICFELTLQAESQQILVLLHDCSCKVGWGDTGYSAKPAHLKIGNFFGNVATKLIEVFALARLNPQNLSSGTTSNSNSPYQHQAGGWGLLKFRHSSLLTLT